MFKYADLREEVTEIDGSDVSVPSLEKVLVGEGAHETENAITSSQNTSYVYHFGTSTKTDYEFKGWYTEQTGGKEVNSGTKVEITADQTLYAHWTTRNTI